MAEDKTCSGFGAEPKAPVAAEDVAKWSDGRVAVALGIIIGNLREMETRGTIASVGAPGAHPTVVLLEAANRLAERKEP